MNEIELTVSDIKAVLDIINLCSARGSFRGQELALIGNIYDKYSQVLEKIKQQPQSEIRS